MSQHAFVDESKVGGLTFYATVIAAGDVVSARTAVSGTRKKGSPRLHFRKESDKVRRAALPVLLAQPVVTYEFDCRGTRSAAEARELGLRAMVHELSALGVVRMVLESDDSVVAHDRRVLSRAVRELARPFEFHHVRPSQEPMLWIPDAVAWCRRNRKRSWQGCVATSVVTIGTKAA